MESHQSFDFIVVVNHIFLLFVSIHTNARQNAILGPLRKSIIVQLSGTRPKPNWYQIEAEINVHLPAPAVLLHHAQSKSYEKDTKCFLRNTLYEMYATNVAVNVNSVPPPGQTLDTYSTLRGPEFDTFSPGTEYHFARFIFSSDLKAQSSPLMQTLGDFKVGVSVGAYCTKCTLNKMYTKHRC
jgi:hypothetical protein